MSGAGRPGSAVNLLAARSLARRLGALILTMLVVSLLVFLALELNVEGVAVKVLGPFSTADQRRLWLLHNGYFDPLPLRYARWLWDFVQGRWGVSTYYHADVRALIAPRLAASAVLMAASLAVTVPLALTLGVLAGIRQGSPMDRLVSVVAILTTSLPEFASAVFLSALFVFWLHWAPGVSTLADGFTVNELTLPVAVLALSSTGYIARMTRASMVEVMASPYVRTARLKGASTTRIVLAHALRNAMGAPVTVILLQIPWLLSGVIVVEVFFAYPGFGTLLYVASVNSDIYLIEACAMIGVIAVVSSQFLSDLINAALNPRLAVQRPAGPSPMARKRLRKKTIHPQEHEEHKERQEHLRLTYDPPLFAPFESLVCFVSKFLEGAEARSPRVESWAAHSSRHPGGSAKRGEPGPSISALNADEQRLQARRLLGPGQAPHPEKLGAGLWPPPRHERGSTISPLPLWERKGPASPKAAWEGEGSHRGFSCVTQQSPTPPDPSSSPAVAQRGPLLLPQGEKGLSSSCGGSDAGGGRPASAAAP